MCKNLIKSVFGGADDPQTPAIQQSSLTARPVASVVKNTDTQRIPGAVISKKKKTDDKGVPGLGL